MGSVTRSARSQTRAEKRDEMSRRLLEALEEHLTTTTFTEVSVDRLVSEAGISRSAFYLHFADKVDLLRMLYSGVVIELMASAETWWSLPASASKAEVLRGFEILLETYRRHGRVMRAVAEVAGYDTDMRAEFDVMMGRAVGRVAQHIALGQREGSVRDGLDPEPVAACLTWMTERVLLQVLGTADPAEAERHLVAMVDVYWHTLYGARAEAV